MCYSAEVSFMTWGFGMACAAFLYLTGHPVKSFLFPLVVTQMQLIEGLRWLNAVDERILSIAGKIQLYIQPIVGMIEGGMSANWIVAYAAIQTLAELLFGKRDLTFEVAEDGHFKWNWLYENVPLATLPYQVALLAVTYLLFPTWIWAIAYGVWGYYYLAHRQYGTMGSLWCVSANFLWIYYLLR